MYTLVSKCDANVHNGKQMFSWTLLPILKETLVSFPGDLSSNFDRTIPSLDFIISMKRHEKNPSQGSANWHVIAMK
jgi:hypothetical protein